MRMEEWNSAGIVQFGHWAEFSTLYPIAPLSIAMMLSGAATFFLKIAV